MFTVLTPIMTSKHLHLYHHLLDNVDEKINIVIIHESQTDINFVPKFIIDHNNLGSIKIKCIQ